MAAKATEKPTISKRRAKFITNLTKTANVSRSARLAGISTSALYAHRAKTPSFAKQWDDAIGAALDDLEQDVIRRARQGVERPVFFGGSKIGSVRNYSDTLAMFVLKAKRPEVYARLNAAGESGVGISDDDARAEVLRRIERLKEDEA